MSIDNPLPPKPEPTTRSPFRARGDLFLMSVLILFLELACIRWFPAHVLFLTFFTNTVLLACFVGMSVGCLAARSKRNYLTWTPLLLVVALAAGHGVEKLRAKLEPHVDVGSQASPQLVFFGTEYFSRDVAGFVIPVEALGGSFFLLLALAMIGPGQELGRALNRLPNRVQAYTVNILGSVVGIVLFAACSWWQLSPLWWFLPVVVGIAYFLAFHQLIRRPFAQVGLALALVAVPGLASWNSGAIRQNGAVVGEHLWSPYYRIDYELAPRRTITVNLIGHQQMVSREQPFPAYALPHLLHRDAQRQAGLEPERFKDVLVIGAGSGNDVSRALQWGARHIDAVEIDPVIYRLGHANHPDQPYQDPRVNVYLDDGRNFLRSAPDKQYDLVVYALVDSLVLHSSYSNLRLESYLFTDQAFADVRRCLKPGGAFVMYNYFRQGWIVARLHRGLEKAFNAEPLVLTFPYRPSIEPDARALGSFTMFLSGSEEATRPVRTAFAQQPQYWLTARQAPSPDTPNGFTNAAAPDRARWEKLPHEEQLKSHWKEFGLAQVVQRDATPRTASDDWPFLYLRQPMIPNLTLRGMAIMGGLALLLVFLFLPRRRRAEPRRELDGRMFFLGAGFMLVETKAVVHMALLFGSTWMVNSVVFFAVLVMILAANLFVLRFRPERLWPYYAGLFVALALNGLVPLDFFLGLPRAVQVIGSCLLVFAPILFAGVIFAVSFGRTQEPGRAFGANIAGALLGGLAENVSMLVGFQYLVLVALAFYALSGLRLRLPASVRREELLLEPVSAGESR